MAIHQVCHAWDLFCAWVGFKGVSFMVFDDLPLHVIRQEKLIWSPSRISHYSQLAIAEELLEEKPLDFLLILFSCIVLLW
jgi:hypothetical protein